jgi:hypothetical protein
MPAFGTFEERSRSGLTESVGGSGAQENARGHPDQRAGPLKDGIHKDQETGRDGPFEDPDPKVGNGQGSFNVEAKLLQPAVDGARVKVEIQRSKFHRVKRERLQAWRRRA